MTTTEETIATEEKTEKITIPMSERRPLKIVKADWPCIAIGQDYSGQVAYQAFDGAVIRVRRHADGRAVVYGYAGDWNGGGRPERENRTAGFLLASTDGEEEIVRAIRRVAGILAETEHVGEMSYAAARRCIADLPAVDVDEPESTPALSDEIRVPRELALRILSALDRAAPVVADELRAALAKVQS
jgi:hypothetical protein